MPDATPCPDELDDAACNRALAILVDVGTALAQECRPLGPNATFADRVRSPFAERAKTYDKVALAVRRTILLFQHLKSDPIAPKVRQTEASEPTIREPGDTIDRKPGPERPERVEHLEFVDDLAHRSPADLIRELSEDLGLATSADVQRHRRRAPEDIEPPRQTPSPLRPPLPPGEGRGEGSATRPNLPH